MARTKTAQKKQEAKKGVKKTARAKTNRTARARASGQGLPADCLKTVTWKSKEPARKETGRTLLASSIGFPLSPAQMIGHEAIVPPRALKAILKNGAPLLFGAMAGFGTRAALKAIVAQFGVAAALTTVPAVAALGAAAPLLVLAVTAATLGCVGGVAGALASEGYKKLAQREEIEKGWVLKTVKKSLYMGLTGGLFGSTFRLGWKLSKGAFDWFFRGRDLQKGWAKEALKEHAVFKMTSAVKNVAAKIKQLTARAKEEAPQKGALSFFKKAALWGGIGGLIGGAIACREEIGAILSHAGTHDADAAIPVAQANETMIIAPAAKISDAKALAFQAIDRAQNATAPTKHLASAVLTTPGLDEHVAQAATETHREAAKTVSEIVAAPAEIAMPKGLGALVSKETFGHLSREVQEKLAENYAGNLSAKQKMALLSDAAYYLLNNKSYPSLSAMPAECRREAAKLLREAATLAQETGALDSKLGKVINANLAYCYRSGIGMAKDLKKATFYALLGQGTKTGDETLALLRKTVPGTVNEVAGKLPLYRKYVLG